jgi:hypothetical protein
MSDLIKDKHALVKTKPGNIYFGKVLEYKEDLSFVALENARRVWKWYGFSLNEVANNGCNFYLPTSETHIYKDCFLSEPVILMAVSAVEEIILTTEQAIESLTNYPNFVPKALQELQEKLVREDKTK